MREEIYQFINQADERILRLIYGMMKADIDEGSHYSLTETDKQILDERLTAHEAAPHEGATWEEVERRIKKDNGL